MAAFCLECWNRMCGTERKKKDGILSRELDFCESCGTVQQVLIRLRRRGLEYYLRGLLRC